MNRRQEPLNVESNQLELVDFRLFEKLADGTIYEGIYGINVSKVREIIVLPRLSKVPDAHPVIEGIFNLRGVQVPAVNLALWLKTREALPEGVKRKVIVTEFSHKTVGLIVHQASRIRRISWDQIKSPPELVAQKHGASIVGTTLIDSETTLLLIDVEKIVAEMQGKQVEELVDTQLGDHEVEQHRARILIIDDSSVARKQMVHTLRKAGYEILEAGNGQEALGVLREMKRRALEAGRRLTDDLQVVVTDVEMPRMDGYSLTTKIKGDAELATLPVIMHSSLSGEANLARGKSAGCEEYMVKFDPEKLLETIERYV